MAEDLLFDGIQEAPDTTLPDPEVESKVGTGVPLAPPVFPLSLADEAHAKRQAEENPVEYDQSLWSAAVENQHIYYGLKRWVDRTADSSRRVDPNFVVTDEMIEPYRKELTFKDQDLLKEAQSEEDIQGILASIRKDKLRHEQLRRAGFSGVGLELLAAITDPVGIAVGLATGGYSWLNKANRMRKIVGTGLAVGAEAAAFEGALTVSDTQRQVRDVFLAAAGGAVLGSGIGALGRAAQPRMAAQFDEVDKAIALGSRRTVDLLEPGGGVRTKRPHGLFEPTTETKVVEKSSEIETALSHYVSQLKEAARGAGKVLKRGKRRKFNRKALEGDISRVAKDVEEIQAIYAAERKAILDKGGSPDDQANDLGNLAGRFDPLLERAEGELSSLTNRLDRGLNAPAAKKKLEEFTAMTRDEQIRTVFPEGVPTEAVEEVVDLNRIVKDLYDEPFKRVKRFTQAGKDEAAEVAEDATPKAEVVDSLEELVEQEATAVEKVLDSALDAVKGYEAPVTVSLPRPIADKVQGGFTTMDHSKNTWFRGLGHLFLENAQGGILPKATASILSNKFGRYIRSAGRNRYNEGFVEWSKSQGRGRARAYVDFGRNRKTFDREVYLYTTNPDLVPNPSIGVKKASEGLAEQFDVAGKLRKQTGEGGFENLTPNKKYMPAIFDHRGMDSIIAARGNVAGREFVEKLLSKGYQEGGYALKPEIADRLAKMQVNRTLSQDLSMTQSFKTVVSQDERNMFLAELRAADVDEKIINDFLLDKEVKEILDTVSYRARASMKINPHTELEGVKVVDMLDHNLSQLSESYIRESAGGAAMATHGIKTYQQALNVINAAEAAGKEAGVNVARNKEEATMLKELVDMIYGKSIEVDPKGGLQVGSRRLREWTSQIRLGQVGFAQYPEAARVINELGLKTVLESVPGLGIFRRRKVRGGKSSGVLNEPELREMEEVLGYIGEDSWMTPLNIRHDDWGEGTSNSIGRVVDNALAAGARLQNITSGFQAIQGGLEKIAMRGMKRQIIEGALGGKGLKASTMKEIGWSEEFVGSLNTWIKKNPATEMYNGQEIRMMNFKAMDPEMRETLTTGMIRLQGRMVQRNFVGETSPFMNKWFGKTLTQFRTFSIVSMEKQLIHDIRGDKIAAFQKLAWSSLLSYMAYSTQAHLRSLGKEDPGAYLDDAFSARNVAFGVFNKLPQTASISLFGDVASTLGAMPDELIGTQGKYGFRAMSPRQGFGVPALGTVTDAVDLSNEVMQLIAGDGDISDVLDKTQRLAPPLNGIGIGEAAKAAVNLTR